MKKFISFCLATFMLSACQYIGSKNYKFTVNISSYKPDDCKCKLYAEVYCDFSGLLHGYLTDSVSFRIYTGAYNDADEMINYHCKGDSIYIITKHNTGIQYYNLDGKLSTEYKTINSKTLSLKELKAKHDL